MTQSDQRVCVFNALRIFDLFGKSQRLLRSNECGAVIDVVQFVAEIIQEVNPGLVGEIRILEKISKAISCTILRNTCNSEHQEQSCEKKSAECGVKV
jgi:hypothetical protein